MSLVELGVAINDGDALDIALAGGSVIIDGLSVLVPGVPGGAGYLLKASKTADGKLVAKVVDEAGNSFKVVDSKLSLELPKGYSELKSVGSAGNSTGDLPNGYRHVVNDKTGDIDFLGSDGKTYTNISDIPSAHISSPDTPGFEEWRAAQKYEDASYHGSSSTGVKNPAPANPEVAFDNSYSIGENKSRRIGIDKVNGEFVVFDSTRSEINLWHGHSRNWDELSTSMQNALKRAGVVNKKGKIL